MTPTALTLFSGGGLADIGLRAAGFQIVGAVEFDPAIAEVYAANHGADHLQVADVCAVDYRAFSGVDWAWVSPKCTNASQANPNAGEDPSDLRSADAICRMLREARPRWFTLENVTGYRTFESYARICEQLRALGYATDARNLQAADYAVPQTRRRLILRAALDGRIPALHPTHGESGRRDGGLFETPPWVGWYEAIEDLLPGLPESELAEWQKKRLPEWVGTCLVDGQNARTEERGGLSVLACREPAMTVGAASKGVPRALLVGGANTSEEKGMPRALLVHPNAQNHFFVSRRGEDPSYTVATFEGGTPKAALPARTVRMTPRALARFQTAPDDYVLPEKATLATRVIGNGVPCRLAQVIAEGWRSVQ